jgi:CRP-like cAMP-binding protein
LNLILSLLDSGDMRLLEPHLETVDLPVRFRLAVAGSAIEHVYFPRSGVASLTTQANRGPPIEIGIVGREGLVNLPALFGAGSSPHAAYMQVAGAGERMPSDELSAAMRASPTLQDPIHRFAHVFMAQNASTVLANGHATVAQRLARWLLMIRDRIDGDELPLTHEFIAIMLGVRRASVSTALRELEKQEMVIRRRGDVVILDRDGLRAVADGFYDTAEDELLRLFGPS